MSMSKKDYGAIAAAVKDQLEQGSTSQHCKSRRDALAGVVNRLLPYLATNPAFNRAKFIRACGLEVVDGVIYDERFALVA